MKTLAALLKREPAMAAGIASAVVALAAAFGFRWPASVVGAVLAGVALLLGLLVRSQVTPVPARPKPAEGQHAAP
jgi:hypothetical protein